MTVGENIKRIRKEKGLTQKKLGELCGINEVQVRQYELGKANPKIETLMKIAKALNVPINELNETITIDELNEELRDIIYYKLYCSEVKVRNLCTKEIINILDQLNTAGMTELIKYAYSLRDDELYKSIYFNNDKFKELFPEE